MPRPVRRLVAALCLLLACGVAQADDPSPARCPLGMIKCPKKPVDWAMCKKGDLLDIYVSGLPTEGDRSEVPANADANRGQQHRRQALSLRGRSRIHPLRPAAARRHDPLRRRDHRLRRPGPRALSGSQHGDGRGQRHGQRRHRPVHAGRQRALSAAELARQRQRRQGRHAGQDAREPDHVDVQHLRSFRPAVVDPRQGHEARPGRRRRLRPRRDLPRARRAGVLAAVCEFPLGRPARIGFPLSRRRLQQHARRRHLAAVLLQPRAELRRDADSAPDDRARSDARRRVPLPARFEQRRIQLRAAAGRPQGRRTKTRSSTKRCRTRAGGTSGPTRPRSRRT